MINGFILFIKKLITLQISKFSKNEKSLNVGTTDL